MKSLNESIREYQIQIKKGDIIVAYRGLMNFMMSLRSHFSTKYPDYIISGSIYYGYMDMTYFAFSPESMKSKKLKIAIVLIHNGLRFEVWLAGYNKQVQARYFNLFKQKAGIPFRMPSTLQGADSILECTLVDNPDFSDPDALMHQIEEGTLRFIDRVKELVA